VSETSPYAWPPNWRDDPRYQRLYETLHGHYGQERTSRIVRGLDDATNADLASWRGLGRHHGPARVL
jgi:hypothetical protein